MYIVEPCPHLYMNVKRMWKRTQNTLCGRVGEQHSPSFACVAYVLQKGKHYPSEVGTSKKNTFSIILMWTYIHSDSQRITSGMLTRSLVQRMLNKQLFGIRWHLPLSHMPCSRARTEVDAPLYWSYNMLCQWHHLLRVAFQMSPPCLLINWAYYDAYPV